MAAKTIRYRLANLVAWLARVKLGLRLDNDEILDELPEGGVIVAALHKHPLDPFFIGSVLYRHRVIRWFAVHTLLTGKWTEDYCMSLGYPRWISKLIGRISGWLIRGCQVLPVYDLKQNRVKNGQVLRQAAKGLKQGQSFGIFPEGQINHRKESLEFQAGLDFLARVSKAPVLLVEIDYRRGWIRFLDLVHYPAEAKGENGIFTEKIRTRLRSD